MLLVIAIAFLSRKRYGTNALALPQHSLSSSAFDSSLLARSDPSDGGNGRAVLDILWTLELLSNDFCVHLGFGPSERALS